MPGEASPSAEASSGSLSEEREAFDRQIQERVRHGHVPDLRHAPKLDWFYNNPWRDPYFVDLTFGEQFRLIDEQLSRYLKPGSGRGRVLEVGCGPGYLSLELSRAGYDVTGLDLSGGCIRVARETAAADRDGPRPGALEYVEGDLYEFDPQLEFDAIVFLGSLHHFPDVSEVLRHVNRLVRPDGIVICHEPTRDRVTRSNAAFVYFLRVLLSSFGAFYESYPLPRSDAEQIAKIDELFKAMRYESADGSNQQSINDNSAGFHEMVPALREHFEELRFEERSSFHHENIGGLRLPESAAHELAAFLVSFDRVGIQLGLLDSTEFFFVGRVRAHPAVD